MDTDLEKAVADKAGVHAPEEPKSIVGKYWNKAKTAALYGTTVDIHDVVEEDPFINALHARAEKFDEHAEHAFGYLQVFSAICVVFAHGAGEVGFMTGPLSCIYDVYMVSFFWPPCYSWPPCAMQRSLLVPRFVTSRLHFRPGWSTAESGGCWQAAALATQLSIPEDAVHMAKGFWSGF